MEKANMEIATSMEKASMEMPGSLDFVGSMDQALKSRTSFSAEALRLAAEEVLATEEKVEQDTMKNKTLTIQDVFCGRDAEILKLEGVFRRTVASRMKYPNLVLVGGDSGAGKSTLVNKLKDHLAITEEEFFWISGKFEEGQQQQTMDIDASITGDSTTKGVQAMRASAAASTLHPFTAIVDAFSLFFQDLEEEEPETVEEVKADILEAVGQQGAMLTHMIPCLARIIGEHAEGGPRRSQISELKRFHLVFRNFLQALASQVRSVVLVLDDIHCADAASLELLEYLLTSDLKHVLFIGTFRSSQINTSEEHRFTKWINNIQQVQAQRQSKTPKSQNCTSVTMMELSAMDLETTNDLISGILSQPPDDTRSLAHIIYTKTEGNVMFATQYVLFLNKSDLLWFDSNKGCWDWDEQAIRQEAEITTSLIDFVRDEMLRSQVAPKILPVAACLGAKFNQRTLEMVLTDISKIQALQEALDFDHADGTPDLLKLCCKEGFIENCGNQNFSFAHDKMQEAALILHPKVIMKQIRCEVGGILFRKLDAKQLDEKLFDVVNLLGTKHQSSVSPFDVAELNSKAAKKAKQMAAFGSASTYTECALVLLPPLEKNNEYEAYRAFLLDVCSLGAEVEAAIGHLDKMKEYCDRIIQSDFQYNIFEQLRVQHVLIDTSGNLGGQSELALNHCFIVLEELGCVFPKSTISKGIRSVTSLLRSKAQWNVPSLEDVENMPLMTDPAKEEAMRLLDRSATYAYLQKDQLAFIMVTTRMARWTIRFGICEKSPPAYALLGLVLMHVLGDYITGTKYAELALSMMRKLEGFQSRDGSQCTVPLTQSESRTTFIAIPFVLCWTRPLHEYNDELVKGYEVGMQVGDTESALHNVFHHISIKFFAGADLKSLEKLCQTGISEMIALQRGEIKAYLTILWQAIRNLTLHSPAEGTTNLSGSAMAEIGSLDEDGWKIWPNLYTCMETLLCTYFGDYEQGAKLALKQGDGFLVACPGGSWGISNPFMRGVCLYAAANTTKKRVYRCNAQKCRATVQSWIKKGNPTAVHQLKLLDAEHAACIGKVETARELYRQGWTLASKGGFIQDEALANERCGQLLLLSQSPNDIKEGRSLLFRSLCLYQEWGAKAKVDMLLAKYPGLSTPKPPLAASASVTSLTDVSKGEQSWPLQLGE